MAVAKAFVIRPEFDEERPKRINEGFWGNSQ
jgi:hypothetical protein